jgi:hypothetical protein
MGAFALLASACAPADEDAGDNTEESPAEAAAVDSGLADVTDYQLTMDGVDRYMAASLGIGRAMQGMTPAQRAAFEGGPREQFPSLDEMVDRVSSNPAAEAAVSEAGLTPREYATIIVSMLQAGIAQARMAQAPHANVDSLAISAGISPATLSFVQDNADELARKREEHGAAMEALAEEYGDSTGG